MQKTKVSTFERALIIQPELNDREKVFLDLMWRLMRIYKKDEWYVFDTGDINIILGLAYNPQLRYHINNRFRRVLQCVKLQQGEILIKWHPWVLQQNNDEPRTVKLEITDDLSQILHRHIRSIIAINGQTKNEPDTLALTLKYINRINARQVDHNEL